MKKVMFVVALLTAFSYYTNATEVRYLCTGTVEDLNIEALRIYYLVQDRQRLTKAPDNLDIVWNEVRAVQRYAQNGEIFHIQGMIGNVNYIVIMMVYKNRLRFRAMYFI